MLALLSASLLAVAAPVAPPLPTPPRTPPRTPLAQRAVERSSALFMALTEEGEGAPSPAAVDQTLVVTEFDPEDDGYAAVGVLLEVDGAEAAVVSPWSMDAAFKVLAERRPGHVVFVLDPARIDLHFHYEVIERATRLDADPFVDFAFGYITGANARDAAEFARSASAEPKLAKDVLDFGPRVARDPLSKRKRHGWAKGFKARTWFHPEGGDGIADMLAEIKPSGLLSSWGMGGPDGIAFGLTGSMLAGAEDLDLSSSILFCSHPHGGVPKVWFDARLGGAKRVEMEEGESFLMGLVTRRPAAVFAAMDVGRGETNRHEVGVVLCGGTLGDAIKATYDDVVMAAGSWPLALPRYEVGKGRPHKDVQETMLAGSASRALFGVPSWTPYSSGAASAFEADVEVSPDAVEIQWEKGKRLQRFVAVFDVLHASSGGWTHRLRFREEVPLDAARELTEIQSVEITKDGDALVHMPATGAVELWGGRAFVHVTIAFPEDTTSRPLWGGRSYQARVRVAR